MDKRKTELSRRVLNARNPEEVFGEPPVTAGDRESYTRTVYRELMKMFHADLNDPDDKALCDTVSSKITELFSLAGKSWAKGGPTGDDDDNPLWRVTGDRRTWSGMKILAVMDFHEDHRAKSDDGKAGTAHVAATVDDNDMVEAEIVVLEKLSHNSLPVLLDKAVLPDGRACAIVEPCPADALPLSAIVGKGQIPQRHLLWMLDRVLSATGFLHKNGIVHGGISTASLTVIPSTHNVVMTDLTLCVPDAATGRASYRGKNDFSHPDLSPDERPIPAHDLFSIGLCAQAAMRGGGRSVETYASRFLDFVDRELLHPDEADAWASWHKLKGMRRDLYGAENEFLPYAP